MKSIHFLILFLFSFLTTIGQDIDKIKLNSGVKISGRILSYEQGKQLVILRDSAKLIFDSEEIKYIEFGSFNESPSFKSKGFYSESTFGLMFGNDRNGYLNGNLAMQLLNGYQFNKHLAVGIGIGVMTYEGSAKYPLIADLRWYFRNKELSPFVSVYGGYNFREYSSKVSTHNDLIWQRVNRNSQGPQIGAQVGIREGLSKQFGYTLSAGYKLQQFRSTYPEYIKIDDIYRVEIKLGLFFN